MQTSRRMALSVGQWMTVVGVIAGLLILPQLRTRTEFAFAAYFIASVTVLFLASILSELVFGIRCPACERWTLRRLSTARSYYGCSACRGRFKRFGSGPWLEATGPEDAAKYHWRAASRPWLGYVAPDDSSDTATGALLRGKKRRVRWGRVFGSRAVAWSKAFAVASKIRQMPPRGPAIAREPGETTSGLLLRCKKRRHGSS